MKETFTGLVDSMEGFVNDNVGKLFNKNGTKKETKKETKKVEKMEIKPTKEPVQTNNEDSLNDHHNNYISLESM